MSAWGAAEPLLNEAIDQDPRRLPRGSDAGRWPACGPRPQSGGALRNAKKAKLAYVVLDGTLIPIDRLAADRMFYSGKHKRPGVNLQVIASPDGNILQVSGLLPLAGRTPRQSHPADPREHRMKTFTELFAPRRT